MSSAKSPPPADRYQRSFSSSSATAASCSPALRSSRARFSRAVAASRPSPTDSGVVDGPLVRRGRGRVAEPLLHPRRAWRGAGRPGRGNPSPRTRRRPVSSARAASSKRCSAWAMPPSIASACTIAHESPIGVRMPTASVASRVAVVVSPSMSDPNADEQQAGGGRPRQVQRPVRRQAGRRAREHHVGSALLDGQERLVPVDVGDQHVVGQVTRRSRGHRRGPPGRAPRRRRTPRATRRAAGPCTRSRAGVSAVERVADAGGTGGAVAEHDPGPAEPVRDRTPSGGRARRTRPARRRRWPVPLARSPGTRAAGRCARAASHQRAVSAYHWACAAPAASARPDSRSRSAGVGLDAVEQPVAHRTALGALDADQGPVDQPADRVQHRARPGTPRAASTCSVASSEASPAKHDSAQSPRWSSGNSSS